MEKTLGGDRLGAGNKQKIAMRNYERSTHNMSFIFRSTMSCGTLVPFMKKIALPGDTWDLDLDAYVNTHPTVGPLFGSYKLQLDVFIAPMRLYNRQLHNNKLGVGLRMAEVKFPIFNLRAVSTENTDLGVPTTDVDNYQVNPSSILAYLGIRGAGTNRMTGTTNDVYRTFNAMPLLAYWDIYKNYYSNKQEYFGWVIHTEPTTVQENVSSIERQGGTAVFEQSPNNTIPPQLIEQNAIINLTNTGSTMDPKHVILNIGDDVNNTRPYILGEWATLVQTSGPVQKYVWNGPRNYVFNWNYPVVGTVPETSIKLEPFILSDIDEMREKILSAPNGTPLDILGLGVGTPPYTLPFQENLALTERSITYSQEGLGIKTYQSDLFNNWLNTDWIEGPSGINEITAIDTSSGSFTVDSIILARKVYDMLNRIAISGGTYTDWLETVYTHESIGRPETPVYHGGLSKEIVFQEVISNSATSAGDTTSAQPLGTLAGKGRLNDKHKGGKVTIRVDEPSIIMGIVSITPRIDYSQGNDWDVHLQTMDDLHKPQLDEIGFQDLTTERMAWWDTYYNPATSEWVTKSAGKQPAWIEYMTDYNRVYGNFAIKHNEMFMVLNRNYTAEFTVDDIVNIQDLTTYIDPRIYNQIFADTSLDSQNFWVQIGVDAIVRRKMSAKVIPNL